MAVVRRYSPTPMSETVAASRGSRSLPSTIREGEILGGKYRLEKEIGRGSMGTVWSAVHLTLGQRVAIKFIAVEHAQAPEARQRFSTEAKAAARLRSRYVVQVYDDGETKEGTPYVVLEYLDGETLEQRLERERDLPLNDAVRIMRHVARALSRAHASGIVHRDLKPGNVFLTRSEDDEAGWVAKVLDFGIAKLEEQGVTSTTKAGALLGTPLFMSPEQIRGANSVDSRSDLYSLGMVFYNMLTGSYAFNGHALADVLVAICTQPLPDLRTAAPWVPASVADWFQRACARDLQARFQSADEMIEAMDLALGVSTGAYNRQSVPEGRIDTLRGHSPPVPHSLPRATALDSGAFEKGKTQVLSTDQAQLKTSHANSAHTLDPELASVSPSRTPWFVGGGMALLLLLGGGALFFGQSNRVLPTSEVVTPPSGHVASAAVVSPVAPPSAQVPLPAASALVQPTSDASGEKSAGSASAAIPAPGGNPSPVRATTTKPAAALPARPNKPVPIPVPKTSPPPPPATPRTTSTDMGF